MARRGYPVTVYEKDDFPGGMLRHAIPDYRLPRDVLDAEVKRVLDLCDSVVRNIEIGSDIAFSELRERHATIFLGLGAQAARVLRIPGADGPVASQTGKRVIVIGGGNTAIDAARSARREGAQVTVLYRRSQEEMPAAIDEVEDAIGEGVEFRFLVSPTQIVREGIEIRQIEVQKMQLGDADEEGRRRPIPIPDQMETLPADTVIAAV